MRIRKEFREFIAGAAFVALIWAGLLVAFGILSGCVVSATHISDPRVANDSFEFACADAEKHLKQITLRGGVCADFNRLGTRHQEFVRVSVEWRPY